MRRIDARRGTENFKALFPTEFELLAKNQQGGPLGTLIRSRVNITSCALHEKTSLKYPENRLKMFRGPILSKILVTCLTHLLQQTLGYEM